MHREKMEFPHRLLLLIVPLLCVGHFGVYGSSTIKTNPVDSVSSSTASSQNPNLDNVPSSLASSQSPYNNPTSPRTTYPLTPVRSSATTTPSDVSPAVVSTDPSTLLSSPQSPVYTPLRKTPVVVASQTTFPLALLTSLPTLASTTLPVNSSTSNIPQRGQLTFTNKYKDLRVTDYDLYSHRTNAQRQLAEFCAVVLDRITNVAIEQSPSGNLVLRFSIEQGYPVFTADALQNLKNRLSTTYLQLASVPLTSPIAVYWTDSGPCPNATCLNAGICDVTLSNEYKCSCGDTYTGARCQDVRQMSVSTASSNNALYALLVLLVIPIAIVIVVVVIFNLRRQQKHQLKKALDLRDVRTIGPRSMLSLPAEPGIRNELYDTRSFAIAFSDTTFSKSVPSSTVDESDSKTAF